MDLTDLFLFLSFESLQQLWLLHAGRLPFILWLVVIAGLAFRQLPHRPRAMRWFLAALGITVLWDGGLGAVLPLTLSGLLFPGSIEVGPSEEQLDFLLWTILPTTFHAAAAFCLLKAAFAEPVSSEPARTETPA